MINPWLLVGGTGMMLAALVPALWWRYKKLVSWRFFAAGGLAWLAAIAVKAAMDLSVTPVLVSWLSGTYTLAGIAILSGVYVGTRTGVLETLFSYVAAVKSGFEKISFDEAVAFGIGFGCAEAFLLGMSSFLTVSVFMAFPQILSALAPAQKAAVMQQLSAPTYMALFPIAERIFTILVHVFCGILVVNYLRTRRFRYFMLPVAWKTLLDGMLPLLLLVFDVSSLDGLFYIELFVAVMGLSSAVGIFWIKERYNEKPEKGSGYMRTAASVSVFVLVVLVVALVLAQPNAGTMFERRPVDFDSFSGTYNININGSRAGTSMFEYVGPARYRGMETFLIHETTNFSSPEYSMVIEGDLYTTVDGRPVFYNSTLTRGIDTRRISCEFAGGMVNETIVQNNATKTSIVPYDDNGFIIANNMISHWALLFRSVKFGEKNNYIARLYSPDMETEVTRSFSVAGAGMLRVQGEVYDVYVFRESTGNTYYVTPEGMLLKISGPLVEIIISDGQPGEGGIFR